MEEVEKISETDIIHRCSNCNFIIIAESNVNSLDNQCNILRNKEFAFFVKNKDGIKEENMKHLTYEISIPNKKIKCRNCGFEIGYFKKIFTAEGFQTVGILEFDKINSEEIKFSSREGNKLPPVYSKFIFESTSSLKQFKQISDIIKSYTHDFYKGELLDLSQKLEQIELNLSKIEDIIETNEI